MSDVIDPTPQQSLSIKAARKLATTMKSAPMIESMSPRWSCTFLPWISVTSGTYRVNKRKKLIPRDERMDLVAPDGAVQLETRHLRAISLFRNVDEGLLRAMLPCFVQEEVKAGEAIVREQDKADKFFILARGKAEAFSANPSGTRCSQRILASGDYAGETGALEKARPRATVQALAPCLVFALERARFEKALKDAPRLGEELARALAARRDALARSNAYGESAIAMRSGFVGEPEIPRTFVDYTEEPREYPLSLVQSIVNISVRVKEIYSAPMDQVREQLRLALIEMRERKEWELINHGDFGLRNQVAPAMRLQTRRGPPTPDDLDELLAKVWKKPAFFLAHPRAIAAFERECTRRGVPPPTAMLMGSPFLTWRGVPLVPCDKLDVEDRRRWGHSAASSDILLLRVGEKEQGVVGLRDDKLNTDFGHSLSVRCRGIDDQGLASYLLSVYFSIAVLAEDALGMLENCDVGWYDEDGRGA